MPSITDCSPHSSLGNSFAGTPDTRFTAFSPEEVRAIKYAGPTTTPHKTTTSSDPFVSATKPKTEQKLSATASAFQPTFSIHMNGVIQVGSTKQNDPMPGTAAYLANVIESANALPCELVEPEITSFGVFTNTTLKTRNLRISSLFNRDVMPVIEASLINLENSGYKFQGTRRVASAGTSTFLRLAHIDDVAVIYNALQASGELSIEYVTAPDFAQYISPQSKVKYTAYEGQVVLRVPYSAKTPALTKKEFGQHLLDLISIEGTLCAWRRYADPGSFHIVAEYADATMAPRAIARLNGQVFGDGNYAISLTVHEPDVCNHGIQPRFTSSTQTPTRRSGDAFDLASAMGNISMGSRSTTDSFSPMQAGAITPFGQIASGFVMPMGVYTPSQPAYFHGTQMMGGFSALPPAGFTYGPGAVIPRMDYGSPQDLRFGGDFSPLSGRDGFRRQQITRGTPGRSRQHTTAANNHHNHVDIGRIANGSDVRTTVMLRNIPNKLNQAQLKAIIDECSFGRYDFMYLRIDFSNDCNVGYAFINFCDPIDIIDFVDARAGKPWEAFKSDKIAEVSYATIQGRDCLVQKFRNSSVMLEDPAYRPKLFFTYHDNLGRVGTEDVFPASDNASKLKRSCENAEHVGLFAPSAGQHMRDEQRRRRSQYDRGTSMAAREEIEYDPQFSGYSY